MLLFLIGLISGIVSGMGIGGGTILIPALVFFASMPQQMAQSVNLAVFFPIAIVALCIHTKNKHVQYKLALPMAGAGLLGAIVGSKIAVAISTNAMRRIFGAFLLVMGIYEFTKKQNTSKSN